MARMEARPPFAFLIHDMQNDHLQRGNAPPDARAIPEIEAIIANHVTLLEAARANGVPVIATGHFLREDYFDAAPWDESAPERGTLRDGTRGAAIADELRLRDDEYLVRKGGGMSAFAGTVLDKLLRRHGTRTLIVAGVSTHVGVESTVRDASDRDYVCVVVDDACRSRAREHHEASLLNLATWFANVVSTEDAVRLMAGQRTSGGT